MPPWSQLSDRWKFQPVGCTWWERMIDNVEQIPWKNMNYTHKSIGHAAATKQADWQACKCELVRDKLCHNRYTFMCYHWGSCTCSPAQWVHSTQAIFPPFVLWSNLLPSQQAVHLSSPIPLCLCLHWKSKQALVERPRSLAPLAGQLSHKNSCCYGNSHTQLFTDCAALHRVQLL